MLQLDWHPPVAILAPELPVLDAAAAVSTQETLGARGEADTEDTVMAVEE